MRVENLQLFLRDVVGACHLGAWESSGTRDGRRLMWPVGQSRDEDRTGLGWLRLGGIRLGGVRLGKGLGLGLGLGVGGSWPICPIRRPAGKDFPLEDEDLVPFSS